MNAKSPNTQKHTPGPWVLDEVELCVFDAQDRRLADCATAEDGLGDDELEANARLIASAPSLLEACQKALADLQDVYEHAPLPEALRLNVVGSIGRLIAACAKAEGTVQHV